MRPPRVSWPWPAGLCVLALLIAAASTAAGEDYWILHAEMRAVRTSATDTSPAERYGEVYDSADYQFLLVLAGSWEHAFLLDLAGGDVRSCPRATVLSTAGDLRRPSPDSTVAAASFRMQDDGRLSFQYAGKRYVIEPSPPLIGVVAPDELFARQPVYQRRADEYAPDPAQVAQIAGWEEEIEIVAFFGTWCQLCKYQLPALLKTLDRAANPHITLTMVALDEYVTEPADWIEECDVGYTPSFIVRCAGEEIGRIEEEPQETIEADLARILSYE